MSLRTEPQTPAPAPALPAIASRSTIIALDVTVRFDDAASALRTGQLVKQDDFTLFEAVSALEVLDPKMDQGFGEDLEDEYDVARPLLPEEVIGIMDQILCLEVGWHLGFSLSQTLFTSIYIDRILWPEPRTLEQAQFPLDRSPLSGSPLVQLLLRSYCLATIKASYYVHSMVAGQHYYEEEDFATQLFHRELLNRFDSDDVQLLLDEALSWTESAAMDHALKTALECRLIFRQELLNAFEADQDHLLSRPHLHLSCVPMLAEIKRTTIFGQKVAEAFSLKVQRTLASSVPPRPMVTIQFPEAIQHLERLCYDATDVYQLCDVEGSENLLSAFWTFMSHKPLPSVYVRTLAQSLLCHDDKIISKQPLRDFVISDLESLVLPNDPLLHPDDGKQQTVLDESQKFHQLIEDFISRCSQLFLNYFRTSCLNRCRIRRTLCHACVDWDNLQAEAEELDGDLRIFTNEVGVEYASSMPPTYSYPLSSWVYHYKLLQLERTIQMGFELSIYAPDELCGMYWYLSHVCATHLSQLDRMSFFAEKHERSRGDASNLSAVAQHNQMDNTLQRLFRIFTSLKATEALARALHRLYAVLLRNGLVLKPLRPYSSNRLRYELRMKPFLPLSVPEPIDFDEFEHATCMSSITDIDALDDASGAVAEARKSWEAVLKAKWVTEAFGEQGSRLGHGREQGGFRSPARTSLEGEWTSDVKNVLRACIATSITVGMLSRRLKRAPQSIGALKDLKTHIPEPGEKDCYHDWWLVPTITDG